MTGPLNRNDLDDSFDIESDDESDKCDLKKNGDWSNKGFYYDEYFNE